MTITRAAVDKILIKRVGKKLAAIGLDGATTDGTNTDLNDPICYSLRQLGFLAADISNVTNADLSAVTSDQLDELLDRAELRAYENAQGNFDMVDVSVGPRKEALSQLYDQITQAITRLVEKVKKYGGSGAELEPGAIGLSYQEHADPSVDGAAVWDLYDDI